MSREQTDPTWCPYCLKCSTMMRMKSIKIENNIQYFECRCGCGAKHERPYTWDIKEANDYAGI